MLLWAYWPRLDYASGLALQHRLHAARGRAEIPDVLLVMEHPATVTLDAADRSRTCPWVRVRSPRGALRSIKWAAAGAPPFMDRASSSRTPSSIFVRFEWARGAS